MEMKGAELRAGVAGVLEGMGKINTGLLQLSTELSPDQPTAKGLIKDLLGELQKVREQITAAGRTMTGGREELERLDKEVHRLRLLLGVAELFHSTLDTDEVAIHILDAILDWVGAERGVLLLQEPETGEHLVRVGRELTEDAYQSTEVALPRTVVGQVLREREPVYATDVQGDPALMTMASVRDLNIRSLACLPLIWQGDILGVVYFDYHAAQRRIGDEERDALTAVCDQAAQALRNANRYHRAREWARRAGAEGLGKLIGTSPVMREVFELVNQVALSPSTSVLITGASGTGKELVARAIHENSFRASEPFVPVNCAAIPSNLLESELFGHEKGAFTDAKTRRIGLIEEADDGTLFLDEIGEMSPALQSKLLRVLEERTLRRLGGEKDISVDIRVVAATNEDIARAVETGEFREDLFYRLNVFPIDLPALKDRGDDVILIANAVIDELNGRLGTRIEPIDPSGRLAQALKAYDWPGNVRELRNVLERAIIISHRPELALVDFPAPIGGVEMGAAHGSTELAAGPAASAPDRPPAGGGTIGEPALRPLKEIENMHIDRVLDATYGNKKRAADILGINLATLYRKLKKRGVKLEKPEGKIMREMREMEREIRRLRRGARGGGGEGDLGG